MSIITGIREVRGIVEISADHCVALRVCKTHFEKRPVETGESVDLEAYADALASIQFADAYEAALTMLDFTARSASELEKKLLAKGYVPRATQAVLERLQASKLIDDREYALRMAESSSRKPVGIYALKRKLRAKGISEALADEALGELDDAQQRAAATQAAEKLSRRYADLPSREARAKLSQALARRGFAWEVIHEVVDHLFAQDDWE